MDVSNWMNTRYCALAPVHLIIKKLIKRQSPAHYMLFTVQQEMVCSRAAVSQQGWLCRMLKGRDEGIRPPVRTGHPGHLESRPSWVKNKWPGHVRLILKWHDYYLSVGQCAQGSKISNNSIIYRICLLYRSSGMPGQACFTVKVILDSAFVLSPCSYHSS